MKMLRTTILVLVLVLLAAQSAQVQTAQAERWTVVPDGAEVVFTSKAPLETFKGRTRLVSGWVEFDPENLRGPIRGEIVVDLASLDTGKNKRNRHMRENHLETDRHPTAHLQPEAVLMATSATIPAAGAVELRLRSTFELHGVTRPLECPVWLHRQDNGDVVVEAAFPVLLSDHDIERPKFLVMKLADEQKVDVRFTLRRAGTP